MARKWQRMLVRDVAELTEEELGFLAEGIARYGRKDVGVAPDRSTVPYFHAEEVGRVVREARRFAADRLTDAGVAILAAVETKLEEWEARV